MMKIISAETIQAMAQRIADTWNPEKIILFGSYARGNPTPDSDVDLLVLLSFEGKSFRKSLEIINAVNPQFSVNILARRPDDTKRRYEQGDPLIREAIDKGKVMYERRG